MCVTFKNLLVSFISCILIIVLSSFIYQVGILGYINKLEIKNEKNNYQIVDSLMNREKESMSKTVVDWAHWNDTYNFMTGIKKGDYIYNNLQADSIKQINLNFIFYVDTNGKIYFKQTNDMTNKATNLIMNKLFIENINTLKFKTNTQIYSGVLFTDAGLYMITAAPITNTPGTSENIGTLIMGKRIGPNFINYINSVTKTKVRFIDSVKANRLKDSFTISKDKMYSTTYRVSKDIKGNKEIGILIERHRDEYKLATFYFKSFSFIFLLVLIIISAINVLIMDKFIIRRLRKLSDFIKIVGNTKDVSLRISESGHDEISRIASTTNIMLSRLDEVYKEMKMMDERISIIMEATNDGYLDYNLITGDFYISKEWKKFIGYDENIKNSELFIEYVNRIHADSKEKVINALNSFIVYNEEYLEVEYKVINSLGEIVWVLHRSKVAARDEKGKPIRIVSALLDITTRKEAEEEIIKLSYSNKLTGLKNRAYLEKKFTELDKHPDINYSIVMGDINGLKAINDTFGHKEGDKLLQRIASILEKCCENDDIVARWGGDEFAILVISKEYLYVSKLIDNIKKECANIEEFGFDVSLALGSAEKGELTYAEAVMNAAEEKMYRSKFTETRSSRNCAIMSLKKTLYEKHSETEEHTERVKKLSIMLGKKIQLFQDKLDELELLSLLHDIGKIGIPDSILMKPGKLTTEEWEIMKQHAEIGYRIAKATPELSYVANEILCHHEKYNGTGYPQGLKGDEIPILSRIINIVDSFDVMTHKRVYKEASNFEYAIKELKACSGTQFDPQLVNQFLTLLEEENIC